MLRHLPALLLGNSALCATHEMFQESEKKSQQKKIRKNNRR